MYVGSGDKRSPAKSTSQVVSQFEISLPGQGLPRLYLARRLLPIPLWAQKRRTHALLSFRQEKSCLIFSMRRISVSLPTRNSQRDPHEKLARYGPPPGASTLKTKIDSVKTAWMTQSQRSRYMKTGGILLFIVFLFYYLAPKGVHVGSGSNSGSNGVSNGAPNGVSNGEGMFDDLIGLLFDMRPA